MPKNEQARKQTGQKYVTQKDVAERAGVSTSIVSYVINNGPRKISEETRQRVQNAIAELGYRPNIHAQNLMRAGAENELASQQFGVIISGPRSIMIRPYYTLVLYGILEEANRHSLSMRFLMFMDELENPVTFNKLIHPEEAAAVILISTGPVVESERGATLTERLRARVPNLVSVGWPNPGIANITLDLEGAVHQTTTYLLGLGHRRIAYIGTLEQRVDGYRKAFLDANLAYDQSLTFDVQVVNTSEQGYLQVQRLLKEGLLNGPARLTAIVTANDELAWGAMRCLKEAGLRIPEDISITGCDNQVLSSYIVPALTTVQLPMEVIGRMAVQTIVQQAQFPEEPAQTHVLPTCLVVRESCAPYQAS